MSIEFVDVATARAARGVRLVVQGAVPSPWSEAAKGLFRLQGVPVRAVRSSGRDPEVGAFSQAHNVPVVFHDDDPPRTHWADIVMLAARLGKPGALVPLDPDRRARVIGMIHELAGENGLGWSARLCMIDAALTTGGARGFPLPVARYLAAKYGYSAASAAQAGERAREVLQLIARALGDADYHGGASPDALDVYSATFLTMLSPISEQDCPRMSPPMRQAFATAHEDLGADVPAALQAHRRRMFERHLAWPMAL